MELNVREIFEKINIKGEVKYLEPMETHTTFRTGGPADVYTAPESIEDLVKILSLCRNRNIPYFILGGGANILVSDEGIEGIVVDMKNFSKVELSDNICHAQSGAPVSNVSEQAGREGLSGLEFIYSMPGSTGGAVWMNARCYGSSVSDILTGVEYLDENLEIQYLDKQEIKDSYGYKRSFFQDKKFIILKARFHLRKGDRDVIAEKMDSYRKDRERKGHFRFPSAGSVFKNNRDFGRPTGAIIESLGLKGLKSGNAQIADFHGNIIINRGGASSSDIKRLVDICYREAEKKLGIKLECEIRFIGRW